MHNGRIRQAVILAAGNGTRLAAASPLPKPLVPVAGRALLDHVLDRLREMEVSKAYIVVGYRSGEIRNHFRGSSDGLEIEWVHNPEYLLPNGISLLSVQSKVRGPFLLLMSDHLFERSTLKDLLGQQIPSQGGILATDSKIQEVIDLGDATKVQSVANRVRSMGKDLADFNA
ncbi:MAG: NTP transferase domain-containing protein, partial [Acidobacteriota bacterium]